jgi:hypothetical protein
MTSAKMQRTTIAIGLSLWIAGFGCIFGCETFGMSPAHAAGAASTEIKTSPNPSCHKAAQHSCCTKRHASQSAEPSAAADVALLTLGEVRDDSVRECPMALNAKGLNTRVRLDNAGAMQPLRAGVPVFDLTDPLTAGPPSFQHNKGSTYLQCCTFLI